MNRNERLVVAFTHGVEFENFDVSSLNPFVEEIRVRVGDERFLPFVFIWHDIFNKKQEELFQKMHGMGKQSIRKLMVFGWTDELGYNRLNASEGSRKDTCFYQIHNKLDFEFKARIKLLEEKGYKVRLGGCGHSWGSQIIMDHSYLYNPLEIMFTMGSPIQYQSISFEGWGHPPPGTKTWVNFWNTDDPVATRIRTINDEFASVVKDVETGSRFALWEKTSLYGSLQAHLSYWKDPKVMDGIVTHVRKVLAKDTPKGV